MKPKIANEAWLEAQSHVDSLQAIWVQVASDIMVGLAHQEGAQNEHPASPDPIRLAKLSRLLQQALKSTNTFVHSEDIEIQVLGAQKNQEQAPNSCSRMSTSHQGPSPTKEVMFPTSFHG